jgi:hypothetical protein
MTTTTGAAKREQLTTTITGPDAQRSGVIQGGHTTMANVAESREPTLDLSGIEGTPRLTVQHHTGDVSIQTWDRPEVLVRIPDDEDGDIEEMFEIRQEGSEIHVGSTLGDAGRRWEKQGRAIGRQVEEALRQGDFASIGEQIGRWVGGMHGPRPDVDVEITVPAACDVAVRSISGEIYVHGVTGNIYLETASGDMRLAGCRGNLLVKTASGGFEANGFSGRLGIRTASGDVSIHGGLLQAFNIGTISGDIDLGGQIAPDGEYGIRTTSGDTNLALPADAACTVQVRTVSGDIDCELPYQRTRESRRHMALAINGGGPTVQFGSISGDLSITELSDVEAPRAADVDATQRLRREDAPFGFGGEAGESFRVTDSTSPTPRQSAEMAVLEAIERGELTVDEGLARLNELN